MKALVSNPTAKEISVKRSGPFSESLDSENGLLLRSSPSQNLGS